MVYVVDASVAAKWFGDEAHSDAARRILSRDHRLHAPDFLLLELDSVFCKRVWRREWKPEDLHDARILMRQVPVVYHASSSLQDRAVDLAIRVRCSVYDGLYLGLAEALGSPVLTADKRLYGSLKSGALARSIAWIEEV